MATKTMTNIGSQGGNIANFSEVFLDNDAGSNVTLTSSDLLDHSNLLAMLSYSGIDAIDGEVVFDYSADGTNWTNAGSALLDNLAGAVVEMVSQPFLYRFIRFVYQANSITTGEFTIVLLAKN